MGSSPFRYSMISFLVLSGIHLVVAQHDYPSYDCSSRSGNYSNSSIYQSNLEYVFGLITSNTDITYGYYNFTFGLEPDRVSAMAECRGDIEPEDCRGCIKNATEWILQDCPNQKEAIGWYETCMIRFSNRSIFGVTETEPHRLVYAPWNVTSTSVDEFYQQLKALINNLKNEAAAGNSQRKYASGNTTGPLYYQIYALVQCTPDLSKQQCNDCLDIVYLQASNYNGVGGINIRTPSCNFRFEVNRFFNATVPLPSLSQSPPPGNRTWIILVSVVAVCGILLISIGAWIFLVRKKRKQKQEETENDETLSAESLRYEFATIRTATADFSDANKLGQGGFGSVYRGKLVNGQEIAVKRLSMNSGQGDAEFKNEVLLVARLQHRNLVRLLGFSIERKEKLLIYEFVPNRSLDYFLFDANKREYLNWERRYKIIEGTARGLLYLHQDSRLRVIHRDLKPSNILLDDDMNPKIADFGMARLVELDQTQHATSRIVGTYGYMAPEYAMHGEFSVKSDVFSFGVLVLEIVSGQRNNSCRIEENTRNLVSSAWKNWRDGTWLNIVDNAIRDSLREQIMRCIHIALLCVQENVVNRPTMASVVLMLNSYSLTLPVPAQPAFFIGISRYGTENSSSGYTESSNHSKIEMVPLSRNEASITELYPR